MSETLSTSKNREEAMAKRRDALIVAGLVALTALCGVARAQDALDVDAARKEGKIVWYTSTPVEQGQKIADMFQKEYGIRVEMFRSGGSAILRRFQQEMDAGRAAADVITTSDPAASAAMTKKGLFVAFKPKNFDKVPDAAKDALGNYVAQRLNLMTIYLRHDKVAPADEPKSWSDVLDAKYKGKLVMTDPSFTALQVSVVGMMSKARGWGFYEKLRQNDIMVVQSNQQASDMLKRGERLIAVGALDSYAADERRNGHPMKTLYPSDGVFVIPSPTAIVKGSPNPNAAKLFAEFMITEGGAETVPGGRRLCGAQRHCGARGQPGCEGHQHHSGRLRIHREGKRAHQAPVQRDFPVTASRPATAEPDALFLRLVDADLRLAELAGERLDHERFHLGGILAPWRNDAHAHAVVRNHDLVVGDQAGALELAQPVRDVIHGCHGGRIPLRKSVKPHPNPGRRPARRAH